MAKGTVTRVARVSLAGLATNVKTSIYIHNPHFGDFGDFCNFLANDS